MENKLKHMEMIQEIIKRMADCSFLLKGWSVTLVAGLMALSVAVQQKIALVAISSCRLNGLEAVVWLSWSGIGFICPRNFRVTEFGSLGSLLAWFRWARF